MRSIIRSVNERSNDELSSRVEVGARQKQQAFTGEFEINESTGGAREVPTAVLTKRRVGGKDHTAD